jgi:hypothetical protein
VPAIPCSCGIRAERSLVRHAKPVSGIPEEALVVRGGVIDVESLKRNALGTERDERFGYLGISVFAGVGMSVEELVKVARVEMGPKTLRNGKLSLSSGAELAGYESKNTMTDHHYDIIVPDVSDETLTNVVECFNDPVRNPVQRDEANPG